VVQSDWFNKKDIGTIIVCELTSVLKRANDDGNVLLVPGEGNLPEQSVVNVSRMVTLDRSLLQHKIGALRPERMREVMDGVRFIMEGKEPTS
jgi:mRNA interferase MazF